MGPNYKGGPVEKKRRKTEAGGKDIVMSRRHACAYGEERGRVDKMNPNTNIIMTWQKPRLS